MNRLNTMARFEEPDPDPPSLAVCENCGCELFDGSEVFKDKDGNYYCSLDCTLDYFGIKSIELEKESFNE